MKAPDKIYLHKIRDEGSSGFHKMWFEQRARCVPSEEYIRKDALVEWANKELSIRRDSGDSDFLPAIVVLDDLIDKLNSL